MKKHIYAALVLLFTAVLIISSGLMADYLIKSYQQNKQHNELSNLVEQMQQQIAPQPTEDGTADTPDQTKDPSNPDSSGSDTPSDDQPLSTHVTMVHPKTGETMQILREYAVILEKNPDTVGWIKIDGTKINYPVLQTPESPNYYLTRDFYKASSKHGSIYANELANLDTPSDNVTLYGHKMLDGSMFAALVDYKSKSFYNEHPYITFDTLTEHHTYQIVAVFSTTAILGKGFEYHTFVDGNIISFTNFIEKCKELSYYDTGVSVAYGDKLLTLSTCDHSIDDGRLVVVAKRIS